MAGSTFVVCRLLIGCACGSLVAPSMRYGVECVSSEAYVCTVSCLRGWKHGEAKLKSAHTIYDWEK